MNNIRNIAIFLLLVFAGFYACEESDRIKIGSNDTTPPDPPVLVDTMLLEGGGLRIYFKIPTGPNNEDLLSIDAEYTAANGDVRRFSVSYFKDSLDVLGMTGTQTVLLYASDKAGNKSTAVPITVNPLESAVSQVFNTLNVIPGFSALLVKWKNKQQQQVNVFAKINYTQQGVSQEKTIVFTSKDTNEIRSIDNLTDIQAVDLDIHVEDNYGNVSETISKKQLALHQDVVISKQDWKLPFTNDTLGGVPMCYGDAMWGKIRFVIDGIIDFGRTINMMSTGGWGRTGKQADGNLPWNLIIDLGAKYELSRLVTHQAHLTEETDLIPSLAVGRYYYKTYNVARYKVYVWVLEDDPRSKPWNPAGWELIGEDQIPGPPSGMSARDIVNMGQKGREMVMYPDDPHFTQPVRWFRYEALAGFETAATAAQFLSEVTLYGKKK